MAATAGRDAGATMLVEIAGREVRVDAEGFLADPAAWDEDLAHELARDLGLTLDEEHLAVLRFARADAADQGAAPTLRRLSVAGGVPVKRLFALFPHKPAKMIAYLAGLPKPVGCV